VLIGKGTSTSQLVLAARNLTRHRTRTLISLSAIAFGVVALLLAGGFIEWIFWAMREAAIQTGLGHIQVTRPGFRDAGLADPNAYLLPADPAQLKSLQSTSSVVTVDQRLVVSGLASSGEVTVAFTGEAVEPEANHAISKVLTVRGDPLSSSDPNRVLLGQGLAEALGVKQGDRVSFIVRLPQGGVSAVEGQVGGVFVTGVKSYDDSAVRMPLTLGRDLLRVRGAHTWVLGLDSTEHTEAALADLKRVLPAGKFELASWFDLSDFYRKAVTLMSQQVDFVALLIAVIIVLGISNTLMMNVIERTGEIGTLMALGTSRGGIVRLFVLEGVLLGVIGGFGGTLIGVLLAWVISWFGIPMPPPPGRQEGYSAELMLTWPLVFGSLALAVAATTLASLYPAWRASRLPIVDALRHNR
jgi:putative ABC transport system permease protein